MKLKEKTQLRKIILRNFYSDTVEQYDRVWFFDDGTWTVTSSNTTITNCYGGVTIGGLVSNIYDYCNDNNSNSINKRITNLFQAIEQGITDFYEKNEYNEIEKYL
jgi:hypothetical protein